MMQNDPRRRPLNLQKTCLLIVDVQRGTCHSGIAETEPYFHERATGLAIPAISRLLAVCRQKKVECIYTVIESLTLDGRDRGLDYKLSGFNIPKGSPGAEVLPAVQPVGDEIIIPKTSSSLFNSTNFEYVLRNIGIDTVLVTGFLTDQCVDHTIRDGADRGFIMVCVEDACATKTVERHETAIGNSSGYCRLADSAELIAELSSL